jgi:glycosyltransferase involved in cell wall biosynthesis
VNLILVFTYGMSVEVWRRQGLLDREVRYYQIMQELGINDVSWLTYGANDIALRSATPFTVLPRPSRYRNLRFSLSAPFLFPAAFNAAQIVKSNQSFGAWTGLVAKIRRPSTKFIVRCGFVRNDENMRKDEGLSGLRLRYAQAIEWASFRAADAVIVTSRPDKAFITGKYGISADKIRIIPNSVDTEAFSPREVTGEFAEPIRVLSVGRMVPMKNFESILYAARTLGRPVTVTLIGDGPHRRALEDLARKDGVSVRFITSVPNAELPSHLHASDVFIMPQLFGAGITKVILEAMACGVFTIASDIESHREVITDGVNGHLSHSDAGAISMALKRVVAMPALERRAILARARADVEQRYSMQVSARKEIALYRELTGMQG